MKAITMRQKLEKLPDDTEILITENEFEDLIDRPPTPMRYLAQMTNRHGYVYQQSELTKPCLIETEIEGKWLRDVQVQAEDAFNPTWMIGVKEHRRYHGRFKPLPNWQEVNQDGVIIYRLPVSNLSYLQLTPKFD